MNKGSASWRRTVTRCPILRQQGPQAPNPSILHSHLKRVSLSGKISKSFFADTVFCTCTTLQLQPEQTHLVWLGGQIQHVYREFSVQLEHMMLEFPQINYGNSAIKIFLLKICLIPKKSTKSFVIPYSTKKTTSQMESHKANSIFFKSFPLRGGGHLNVFPSNSLRLMLIDN